ncbi:CTP synthetase [Celeribacter naphthalenivorans]|uniref:CTP synthetase n=1 Tax=Celeribacter naphthalenivorans TaxID=1614694 RepID=UPI001CF9A5A8|nr:CTP synthetase [Celeribacter naphthalenivorans]
MNRLAGILFSLISTTLMGTAVVVALTMGKDTLQPILIAAAIGFVVSVPVTWVVTKKILKEFS